MAESTRARVLFDGARSATLNMAVDEMLLYSQSLPGALPTLRFYGWEGPALSVGYFQDVRKMADRAKGVPVVRRLTGGGMVRHGNDLTFSLLLPYPNPFFSGEVKESYLKVNEALLAGLKDSFNGLDFADCKNLPSGRGGDRVCFESPSCYDLMIGKKKVVGASQRRLSGAVLHQSSIFLEGDRRALADRIAKGFEKKWGLMFEEKPLSRKELDAARRIEAERYASEDFFFLSASFLA